jgi:hypothetical protein
MTGIKEILSDEVRHQIEELALEQKREPADVLEEAVRRYAAVKRLERFAEKAGGTRGRSVLRKKTFRSSWAKSGAKTKPAGASAAGNSGYQYPRFRAGVPAREAVPASAHGARW